MKWPLTLAAVAAAAALLLGALLWSQMQPGVSSVDSAPHDTDGPSVFIGGVDVRVTIAQTQSEREKGLGGHAPLGIDEGMLFVFPKDGVHAFWMKDMQFAIDIIWISADGTIVHVVENVSPDTYPTSFASPGPARYVLEVPAGFVASHNVQIGDVARL